jgi:hypothetical protein
MWHKAGARNDRRCECSMTICESYFVIISDKYLACSHSLLVRESAGNRAPMLHSLGSTTSLALCVTSRDVIENLRDITRRHVTSRGVM